jgi:hypothetical protein
VQNGMPPNCTRLWLTRLGSTPEGRELLDAGITNNLKEGMRIDLVSKGYVIHWESQAQEYHR